MSKRKASPARRTTKKLKKGQHEVFVHQPKTQSLGIVLDAASDDEWSVAHVDAVVWDSLAAAACPTLSERDVLVEVNGTSLRGLSYTATTTLVQSASRPISLVFEKPAAVGKRSRRAAKAKVKAEARRGPSSNAPPISDEADRAGDGPPLGVVEHVVMLAFLVAVWLGRRVELLPFGTGLTSSALFEWSHGGLDTSVPQGAPYSTDGGAACEAHVGLLSHLTEHAFGVLITGFLYNRAHRAAAPLMRTILEEGPTGRHWIQYPLAAALWGTILVEAAYKILTHKLVFLLSPCHLVCFAWTIVATLPRESKYGAQTLVFVIATTFAPTVALIVPDVSALHMWGETTTFFVEHVLAAIVAPVLVLCVTHTHIVKRWSISLQAFGYSHFYLSHYWLGFVGAWGFAPLAYLTAANLNYMLCPPIEFPLNAPHGPIPKPLFRTWGLFFMAVCSILVASAHVGLAKLAIWARGASEARRGARRA